MDLSDVVTDDLRTRLHRVEGQIRGIEKMLDEGRECRDLVTQVSAANKALEQVGFRLVSAGLTYSMTDPDKAEADGYPLDEVEKLFLRLG
jgi:DNA-binding FrmR family transcriptional regulator